MTLSNNDSAHKQIHTQIINLADMPLSNNHIVHTHIHVLIAVLIIQKCATSNRNAGFQFQFAYFVEIMYECNQYCYLLVHQ